MLHPGVSITMMSHGLLLGYLPRPIPSFLSWLHKPSTLPCVASMVSYWKCPWCTARLLPLCLRQQHLPPTFRSLRRLQAIRFGYFFYLFRPRQRPCVGKAPYMPLGLARDIDPSSCVFLKESLHFVYLPATNQQFSHFELVTRGCSSYTVLTIAAVTPILKHIYEVLLECFLIGQEKNWFYFNTIVLVIVFEPALSTIIAFYLHTCWKESQIMHFFPGLRYPYHYPVMTSEMSHWHSDARWHSVATPEISHGH